MSKFGRVRINSAKTVDVLLSQNEPRWHSAFFSRRITTLSSSLSPSSTLSTSTSSLSTSSKISSNVVNPPIPLVATGIGTTVAVTGSTGYIGSFVVKELLDRGYTVNAPIRGSTKNPEKAQHLQSLPWASTRLKIFDGGDLDVAGSFDSSFEGATAVIHTAAEVQYVYINQHHMTIYIYIYIYICYSLYE